MENNNFEISDKFDTFTALIYSDWLGIKIINYRALFRWAFYEIIR